MALYPPSPTLDTSDAAGGNVGLETERERMWKCFASPGQSWRAPAHPARRENQFCSGIIKSVLLTVAHARGRACKSYWRGLSFPQRAGRKHPANGGRCRISVWFASDVCISWSNLAFLAFSSSSINILSMADSQERNWIIRMLSCDVGIQHWK